jgi:rsbT co-antagonist protein RsbR
MVNLAEVTKRIRDTKFELADYVTEIQREKYPEQLSHISNVLHSERVKLIDFYGELLTDDMEVAMAKITDWGRNIGRICSELGMSIDMALDEVHFYRERFSEIIFKTFLEQEYDLPSFHNTVQKMQKITDQAVQSFSIAFAQHQKDILERAQMEIAELSVPVVPLEKEVAILPLIGTIDTYRAKLLMEESLRKSSEQGISYFILDLSGVLIVDTMVASQLFQVINALKLLGVEAVISGIRPEIAQTMVALGINFTKIRTYSTLQQAISAYKSR